MVVVYLPMPSTLRTRSDDPFKPNVLNALRQLNVPLVDFSAELLQLADPMSVYRMADGSEDNHYNEDGHSIRKALLRIGLLTVATSILVIITVASLPVSLNALAVILMIVASLTFLLGPAMLDSTLGRRRLELDAMGETSESWPSDERYSSR